MPEDFENILKQYDYQFPEELIAQEPASPRDSAKLLVYERTTKKLSHSNFKHLPNFIEPGSLLILNQTKVIPARLEVTKPTGGKVQLLFTGTQGGSAIFLANKKLEPGLQLNFGENKYCFKVINKAESGYSLKPNFKLSDLESLLRRYGSTPLPPYIKHSPLKGKKLAEQYQTVFAKKSGSVAAPTASLHLTKELLNELASKGIKIGYVTLHVNLGTFASLTADQLQSGKLHSEWYEIPKSTIKLIKQTQKSQKNIIAVGTTVVRTLESACDQSGKITKPTGTTSLFIREDYRLKIVNQLITNFHIPKSSLLMLVSAFVGRKKLLEIYKLAINKKYRLFSFGDGMLIK